MPSRAWQFKTIAQYHQSSVAHLWRWEAVAPDGTAVTSVRLFRTLLECVLDAQRNGFKGSVDPADGAFLPGGENDLKAIDDDAR
jgi:hypothetical protein